MAAFKYGTDAAFLGPKTASRPDPAPGKQGWKDALVIDRFWRSSGRPIPATPTSLQMKWDDDRLYVLILNLEEPDNEDQRRRDIDELFLSGAHFGRRDFAVFSMDRDGNQKAFLEKGFTYRGAMETMGREQPNGIPFEVIYNTYANTAEITDLPLEGFETVTDRGDGYWSVSYAIPWTLIGGKPAEIFRFQVYRERTLTGEISSPTALDEYINLPDWFEYDPICFLEGHLGGTAGPVAAEDIYITLPSGEKRWTRYAEIEGPAAGEPEALRQQLADYRPTDADNVRDHLVLVQRLQDILQTEGLDFYWDNGGSRPFSHRDPWNERHVFNQYMIDGDPAAAYRRLDDYVQYFKNYIAWYYTDGTLDDLSDQWDSYEVLTSVRAEGNEIRLGFETAAADRELILSFADDGVRVRSGKGGGRFDAEAEAVTVTEEAGWTLCVCGGRTVEIVPGADWHIVIGISGRPVFTIDRCTFRRTNAPGKEGYELNVPLTPDEMVYGFGERFDAVNQRGHVVALYQRDAYMSIMGGLANETYKNIPLIHFGSGYTMFVNSTYRIRADVGVHDADRLRLGINDPGIDLFLWAGKSRLEDMRSYAKLTGYPMLPPKWAFEPWAGGGSGRWRNGPLGNLAEEQMGVIQKFQELDIPHAGFYAEGASQESFGVKDPGEVYRVSAFAEARGIHALSWEFSVMNPDRAAGYLGDDKDLPLTTHPGYTGEKNYVTYIDFSHPRAMDLLQKQWESRFRATILGTMVDFGDKIPDEAVFHDGRTGKEMHNGYALDYAMAYRRLFESRYGDDHAFYQRAGAAGCQSYACEFGGDQPTSFVGMKQAMNGGFSVASSGLPFWGVDACGYDGFSKSDAETYMRWTAWAAFCPLMRYHGTAPKEPWEYTDQVVGMYKFYAWLRENLLNYSYSTAIEAHHTGYPIMRLLPMVYPDSRTVQHITDEYMYGDHLLVAPIYTTENLRKVAFPGGRWVNLFDNREIVEGDSVLERAYPITEIPVYVADGAVLPLRINENLLLGASMTKSEVKALLVTKPVRDGGGSWFGSDTEENCYAFSVDGDRFTLQAKGTGDFRYLMVKGLRKVNGVCLNGTALEKAPAKQGLYQSEKWFAAEDGTLYVRTFMHSELTLTVDGE